MADIYEPGSAEGFELCQPVNQSGYGRISSEISGRAQGERWTPIAMRLVRLDEGKELRFSDSPWFGADALIFRESAIEKVGSLLRLYGELLPIDCNEAKLWFFNPTRVVDAMDEEASNVRRFSNGRIMRVTRYSFRAELVANVDIFKIPNLDVSPTFVSERFAEAWTSAGLSGLIFKRVWSG